MKCASPAAVMGLLAAVCAIGLSGCAANFAMPEVNLGNTIQTPIGNLQGSTYGGQQPVWQSHVYLMKASTSGYGSASTSILKASASTTADTTVLGTPANPAYYLTTDYGGNFNLTGDYTCNYNPTTPSQSDQIYILSLGGNTSYLPGPPASGGYSNAYLSLMAVLGPCPSSGSFTSVYNFVYVNEISTVAAAYALAGFASNSHSIGSGSSALSQLGMANAFLNAGQLYDPNGSGGLHEARTVTANGNGTVPYKLLNTLGNILASCINQGGSNTASPPTSGSCLTLYNNTGGATSDVASAMMYIAKHPGSNIAPLFALQASYVQFIDDLASQPNDFAVGIDYAGTGLNTPVDVAVDATGNAWVTSSGGYLSDLSPLGVQTKNSPFALAGANYVAIDAGGSAWVTSTATNSIDLITNTAGTLSNTLYTVVTNGVNDFTNPAKPAAYGTTYTYVANPGGGAQLFGLLGATGDVGLITPSNVATPVSLYGSFLGSTLFNEIPGISQTAVDSSGYVWISGDGINCTLLLFCYGTNVQRVPPTSFSLVNVAGAPTFNTQVGTFACFIFCSVSETPQGIAIDGAGNGWVAVSGTTDKVSKLTNTGTISASYTGGGLNNPYGVAIDGSGNVWLANTGGNSLSEFTSAGAAVTGTSGYIGGLTSVLSTPTNLDIDESGDVWVVNSSGNSVTEFIGLATPSLRPLATAASTSTLASKP